jgi:TolA-binding protein
MKQLQQAQDKNFAALTVMTQQALDASNRANTAVAVIQSSIQQSLRDQQEKVTTPVVGLTTRMDSLSNDFRQVSQAVGDLTQAVSQLKGQLSDLNNAVKVLSSPPVPPPGSTTGPGGVPGQPGVQVPPAQDLYSAADHDRQGGNMELALQEFGDFLKYYGTNDNAPLAQYNIGWIHYSKGDYESAANDFDMVLEKYPENPKTKDAMYYKGMSLVKSGKRSQGSDEFKELIARYPRTDQANQACTQLISLGLHCPTAAAAPPKGGAKKKKA